MNYVTNTVRRVVIVTKVVMIQQQVIEVQCHAVFVRVQNQNPKKGIDLVVVPDQKDPDHDHMNHEKTKEVNISNNHIADRTVVIDIGEVEIGVEIEVENEAEDVEANQMNIADTMIDQRS